MHKLSDDEMTKYVGLVEALVQKFPDGRRELVQKMLEGPIGEQYYLAPASSREEYHSCYVGGLMVHSLNVVQNLKKVSDALCPGVFDKATLAFVGLFHDLGKAGIEMEPHYLPKNSDWHAKQGIFFETNKACPYMPTADRGLYLLQKYGIRMSSDEWLAIKLNDGQYIDENRSFGMKEPDLALLLHWADRWSSSQEKQAPSP